MPYIESKDRPSIDIIAKQMEVHIAGNPGKLVYLLHKYGLSIQPKFFNYALLFGALILFMLEFFKRIISLYEDKKRQENGDVN